MSEDRESGLAQLQRLVREAGLKITRELASFNVHQFTVSSTEGSSDITLSGDFLSDLPGQREYQSETRAYLTALRKRLQNAVPTSFYCASGTPLSIETEWLLNPVQMRPAGYLHTSIVDLRQALISNFSIIVTHQQDVVSLRRDLFLRQRMIVNTVRKAVDDRKLAFFREADHPTEIDSLALEIRATAPSRPTAAQFIKEKVYWLGFKQGDMRTRVWIADPWDAEYLGMETKALLQAAQVLQAQKMIVLDPSHEFASAGDELLRLSDAFESLGAESVSGSEEKKRLTERRKWDIFICHASEDKANLVAPLALALHERGCQVWYDDFTLKLGDSLRRSIDQGLKDSRFGVVVLSPAFFAKAWPQRELDGLVALEVKGRKVILPVWHNVTADHIRDYSPTLADRIAVSSSHGLAVVVSRILEATGDQAAGAENGHTSGPHALETGNARPEIKVSIEDARFHRGSLRSDSWQDGIMVTTEQLLVILTINFSNHGADTTIDRCGLVAETPSGTLKGERFWNGDLLHPEYPRDVTLPIPKGVQELESNVVLRRGIGVTRFVLFKVSRWLSKDVEQPAHITFTAMDAFGREWKAERYAR